MPRTFLGKPAPVDSIRLAVKRTPVRRLGVTWLAIALGYLGTVGLAGVSLAVGISVRPAPTQTSTVLAPVPNILVGTAQAATAAPVASAAPATATNPCSNINFSTSVPILPILDSTIDSPSGCNPTYWNLNVAAYLAWKALYAMNWFAGVAAVCLTVYAGLLYISGFANEANVKQAKTLLIVCYTGLLIIFGARIIILGFAGLLGSPVSNTTIGGAPVLKTTP